MLIDVIVSLVLLLGFPAPLSSPTPAELSVAVTSADESEDVDEQNTSELGGRFDPDGFAVFTDPGAAPVEFDSDD